MCYAEHVVRSSRLQKGEIGIGGVGVEKQPLFVFGFDVPLANFPRSVWLESPIR